jgi:ParB-like chromosome segregation protein Spo0J
LAVVTQRSCQHPVGVRPLEDGRYEAIFDHRRLEAARRAGFRDIAATVFDADDDQVLVLALVENLHRRALTGAERVRGLRMLAANHRPGRQLGLSRVANRSAPTAVSTDLCRRLGMSRHTLHRWLALAHQPELLEAVEAGRLEFTAASLIATAPASERAGLQAGQERSPMPRRQLAERVLQLRRYERTNSMAVLERVLRSLEHVDQVRSDREHELPELILGEAERLLGPRQALSTPAGHAEARKAVQEQFEPPCANARPGGRYGEAEGRQRHSLALRLRPRWLAAAQRWHRTARIPR